MLFFTNWLIEFMPFNILARKASWIFVKTIFHKSQLQSSIRFVGEKCFRTGCNFHQLVWLYLIREIKGFEQFRTKYFQQTTCRIIQKHKVMQRCKYRVVNWMIQLLTFGFQFQTLHRKKVINSACMQKKNTFSMKIYRFSVGKKGKICIKNSWRRLIFIMKSESFSVFWWEELGIFIKTEPISSDYASR